MRVQKFTAQFSSNLMASEWSNKMTKEHELKILDEAISKLGTDSYLQQWLYQVRGEVEAMIRADLFPDCKIQDAITICENIKRDTRERLDIMENQAKANSAKLLEEERKNCYAIRKRSIVFLEDAIKILQ